MRHLIFILSCTSLLLFSCDKSDIFGKNGSDYQMKCDLGNSTVTTSEQYMNPNTNASNTKVDIIKDLVTNEDCNCIVSGMVKYRENGKTAALVDYGNGDCNNWVAITICHNGDCEDSKAKCYKFEQDCGSTN